MNQLDDLANQTLDSCESTNEVAKKLAENGYPHGTWISSKVQTAGRGRLGRKWVSDEGNLFLSIIVRISDKSLYSWIPLTIAISILQFLRTKFPELHLQVKWPNDILLNRSKIGGILCEAGSRGSAVYIVIGIGLNCTRAPEGLDQEVTDLSTALGREGVTADQIRGETLVAVLEGLDRLQNFGSDWVRQSYDELTALPKETEISWGSSLRYFKGKVIGLGSSGELLVRDEVGKTTGLFAEDVKILL